MRAVRSAASVGRLVVPSLRANKGRPAKSQLLSVLAPHWWNKLPTDVRPAESLAIFCKRLKTHLFRLHLDPCIAWLPWQTCLLNVRNGNVMELTLKQNNFLFVFYLCWYLADLATFLASKSVLWTLFDEDILLSLDNCAIICLIPNIGRHVKSQKHHKKLLCKRRMI